MANRSQEQSKTSKHQIAPPVGHAPHIGNQCPNCSKKITFCKQSAAKVLPGLNIGAIQSCCRYF